MDLIRACNGIFLDREFPDLWHSIHGLNKLINEDKLSPFSSRMLNKQLLTGEVIITEIINCGSLS